MKYSKGFERDFSFYMRNLKVFTFCGTAEYESSFAFVHDRSGLTAKDAFFLIESRGRKHFSDTVNGQFGQGQHVVRTRHVNLLSRLFLVKSSINFHIKQWAEGRTDGTLPLSELSKKRCEEIYGSRPDGKTLAWVNGNPVYYEDLQEQYGLPEWVIDAVDKQFIAMAQYKVLK